MILALGVFAGTVFVGPSVNAREPVPARTPGKPHPKSSPTPTPTTTPTPTPTPSPQETEQPSGSGTPNPSPEPTSEPPAARPSGGSKTATATVGERATGRAENEEDEIWWDLRPSIGGTYTTATLLAYEDRLRAAGAPPRMLHTLFAPFIIQGPSEFSDTWGAVRHDNDHSLRPHLGQDVFCDVDAPVLAAEPGRVEFVTDRLGGIVVRLHRDVGGYWYYAHLARYADGLSSGDRVETGDVIGHCGDSGNAAGGAPHVHFGSYPGPQNPMADLVSWLRTAERKADRLLRSLSPKAAKEAKEIPRSPALPGPAVAEERCPVTPTVTAVGIEIFTEGPAALVPAEN